MTEKGYSFSTTIKATRKQLGLSQEALAREIGVSFASINRWENGKTTPMPLQRSQFEKFCVRMIRRGRLVPEKP